jgi:poly [ADP-ribose] polymerase
MKMMTNQMKEIGYDAKKMPLGKLGKNTVKEGYAVLSKIMNEVKTGKNRAEITKLSSEFYTLIPHDFGFK